MPHTPEPTGPGNDAPAPGQTLPPKTWTVGTLIYTRRGLVAVFLWMLWGDLVFQLVEKVFPLAMPFQLQRLGIPHGYITMMMGTLTQILSIPMNPFLSFRSDRYRSRWGRRIPYIFKSTLPLALCLAALGFSDDIGAYIKTAPWLQHFGLSSMAIIIIVLSAMILVFDFFNVFINTIFYYLFADVIPRPLLGRFYAMFRITSMGAGSLFGFFVQRYIEIQTRYIYLGTAVLYLVGFSLVCSMVREGEYPPPKDLGPHDAWYLRFGRTVKLYCRECFSHPIFIWFYLSNAMIRVADAGLIGGTMNFFFRQYLHITQGQMGTFNGISNWCFMVVAFPLGWVVDKIHPMRAALVALFCLIPLSFTGMYMESFALYMVFFIIRAPFVQLQFASDIPLHIRLFPRKQYGQFASANGSVRSLTMFFGTIAGGWFFNFFDSRMGPRGDAYCFLWMAIFQAIACGCIFVAYLYWKAHGAEDFVFDPDKPFNGSLPLTASGAAGAGTAPANNQSKGEESLAAPFVQIAPKK